MHSRTIYSCDDRTDILYFSVPSVKNQKSVDAIVGRAPTLKFNPYHTGQIASATIILHVYIVYLTFYAFFIITYPYFTFLIFTFFTDLIHSTMSMHHGCPFLEMDGKMLINGRKQF